jgi:uncharacterized membrane protein
MKRLVKRFGKLITASFFLMGIGLIVFLLTPLSLWLWDADIDIPGALIFVVGALLCAVGFIVRRAKSLKQ